MKPTVVILAGGVGKRFKPFQMSKPLFPLLGSTLIERTVTKAQKAGFEKCIIVTNPKDQEILDPLFASNKNISTVIQQNPLGMGNAVLAIKDRVGNEPILILNATDIVSQSLFDQMSKKVKSNTPFIVGKKVDTYFNGGYIQSINGRVTNIIEKPGEGNEPSNLISLVFDYIPDASHFIELIEKTDSATDDQFEKALTAYMTEVAFEVVEYDGYWQPTKYPWDLLAVTEVLLEHELSVGENKNKIASSAKIDTDVHLGTGVVVHENAVIKGPSYIGDNTIIGNNSFIRSSYIGKNCVIGTNSEVARSYIGDGCWLHQNYVGDSVLESNVAMGAGSITANFRLDEKTIPFMIDHQKIDTKRSHLGALIAADVRIGINASLMPGIKIGHSCVIGPTCLVNENIDRFTRVIAKSNLEKVPFNSTIGKRS